MKTLAVFCVIFVALFIPTSSANLESLEECEENEIYKECKSKCNPHCPDPHGPVSCPRTCVLGCGCSPGFAKDENNKCTVFSECSGYQSNFDFFCKFLFLNFMKFQFAANQTKCIEVVSSIAEKLVKTLYFTTEHATWIYVNLVVSVRQVSSEMKTLVHAFLLKNVDETSNQRLYKMGQIISINDLKNSKR